MSGLQSNRPASQYNAGEQNLYTGIEMMWTSYGEHLGLFEGWSTLYSAVTGTDQLAALAAVKALPNEAQRSEEHTSLNKELNPLVDECLIIWKRLESYIRDGFPALVFDDKLSAAGYGFYEGASSRNWEDVRGLMNAGELFIAANIAELTAGGMTVTFAVDFTAAKDAFALKHSEFLQTEELSKVKRDEKIMANNALYEMAMKMGDDGKKIFRQDAAVREQFTWDRVQSLISSTSSSHSVKGLVYNSADDRPLVGARVDVLNMLGDAIEGKNAVTDAGGLYRITGLKNGTYILRVSMVGYDGVEQGFVIKDGAVDLDVGMVGEV